MAGEVATGSQGLIGMFKDRFNQLGRWKWVAVALFVVQVVKTIKKKMANLPPGPMTLPILGNFYMLTPDPKTGTPPVHKHFWNISRKFGGVVSFYFGNKYTVILSTPEAIKEALKDKSQIFAGRFVPESMNIITRGVGIALQPDLERWKRARSALQTAVTSKKAGEVKAPPIINEEVQCTIVDFVKRAQNNQPIDLRLEMKRESLNVILRAAFGFRYGSVNEEFNEVQYIIGKIFESISAGNPSDYMPIFRPFFGKFVSDLQAVTDRRDKMIKSWVDDHKKTLDASAPRDFVDEMLIKQKEIGLTDDDIIVILWDMMAGGIDTSATSMEILIYLLINHPHVQKKLHDELDSVVGPNRLPTLDDIPKLPYLLAVICEQFRHKHFAPFGIPHATNQATTLQGYNIPKGAQVMPNLYALHHDPKYWKNPNEFRPERWLEEEKDLTKYFLNAELPRSDTASYKFIPFGCGMRMCVGFGLGRIVMVLKAAMHFHAFKFESEDGAKLDLETEHFGITLQPNQYNVKVVPRPAAKLAKAITTNCSVK
jgi:cytochrome P450